MVRCKICSIISIVDSRDAYAIKGALQDDAINNTELAEVLTKNGHPVTEATVRRHLKHGDN
jgi:hypothetical protein